MIGGFDQAKLSFLRCLHTVDKGLQIIDNAHLTSTEGLTTLHSLSELQISGNPKLQVITGFTQIDDLFALRISNNPMLNETHLGSAFVRFNAELPESKVNAQLDTLKVENRVVCGNEGGDSRCYCPDGD